MSTALASIYQSPEMVTQKIFDESMDGSSKNTSTKKKKQNKTQAHLLKVGNNLVLSYKTTSLTNRNTIVI